MTTEQRLSTVEDTQDRILDLIELLTTWIEEDRRQIRQNERRIQQNEQILEEIRRDNKQTQKIWIAFARHHGWPEDLEE